MNFIFGYIFSLPLYLLPPSLPPSLSLSSLAFLTAFHFTCHFLPFFFRRLLGRTADTILNNEWDFMNLIHFIVYILVYMERRVWFPNLKKENRKKKIGIERTHSSRGKSINRVALASASACLRSGIYIFFFFSLLQRAYIIVYRIRHAGQILFPLNRVIFLFHFYHRLAGRHIFLCSAFALIQIIL